MHGRQAELLAGLSIEGQIIAIFICVLLVIACILWVFAMRRLITVELSALQRIKKNRFTVANEAYQLLTKDSSSILVRALRASLDKGSLDEDAINYADWIHWPRFFAGVFVFIGLVGTVWGIAVAIANLGATVSITSNLAASTAATSTGPSVDTIQNWTKILQGIDQLLSGMRSASICTLFGLAATVFVSLLNSVYIYVSNYITSEGKLLAESVIVPLHQEEQHYRSIQKAADKLAGTVNLISEKMPGLATEMTRLASELQLSTHTLQDETKRLESGYSTVKELLAGVPKDTYDKIHQISEALSVTATALDKERDDVNTSAVRMEKAVRELKEQICDALQQQSKDVESIVKHITRIYDRLQDMLHQYETILLDVSVVAGSSPMSKEVERLRSELLQLKEDLREQISMQMASPHRQSFDFTPGGEVNNYDLSEIDRKVSIAVGPGDGGDGKRHLDMHTPQSHGTRYVLPQQKPTSIWQRFIDVFRRSR